MKTIDKIREKLVNFNKNRCKTYLHLFQDCTYYCNENGRTYKIGIAEFLSKQKQGNVCIIEYDKDKRVIKEEFVW